MGRLAGIARREGKRAPMESLDSAEITRESGVAGDFRGNPGKRQVTLLSMRDWQLVCAELDSDIPWTVRRANLLLEDLELPQAAGHIITIGNLRLKTTVAVDPCSRMDEQVPGLTAALRPDWRGGVACEVLEGGVVSIGDSVHVTA